MTATTVILADLPFGDLIVFLAILIIGGLGSLGKWLSEKSKERERQREIEIQRAKRLREQGMMPIVDRDDDEDEEENPFEHATPIQRPVSTSAQRAVRRSYRTTGTATPSRQPMRILRPPREEEAEDRVDDELRQEQQRMQRKEHERQQRMTAYKPGEADTAAIQQRLVSVGKQPASTAAAQLQHGPRALQVNLNDPSAARNAIVLHEILGPPKALQSEQALWET